MKIITTGISDLVVIEPDVFEDPRGYFFESYNQGKFFKHGLNHEFIQDNQSESSLGVIRGLHYQLYPYSQTKLVRVLSGKIFDVAVDIRKGSPTFGKWYGVELSCENKLQLLVPRGFAHGFSVLSRRAVVFYKCDNLYKKESERGIIFRDKKLAIDWKTDARKAIVSERDNSFPAFADAEMNFIY